MGVAESESVNLRRPTERGAGAGPGEGERTDRAMQLQWCKVKESRVSLPARMRCRSATASSRHCRAGCERLISHIYRNGGCFIIYQPAVHSSLASARLFSLSNTRTRNEGGWTDNPHRDIPRACECDLCTYSAEAALKSAPRSTTRGTAQPPPARNPAQPPQCRRTRAPTLQPTRRE